MKTLAGALILLVAVALLVFWEAQGRAMFLMEDVLVAREAIPAGAAVTAADFRTVSVPAGAVVENAVKPGAAAGGASPAPTVNGEPFSGLVAGENIRRGAQLSADALKEADAAPPPDPSCYVIRNEWIALCTSSLRRGDTVEVLSADGARDFGTFTAAYVKDSEGREVTDAAPTMRSFTDPDEGRANASSPIHHIEIRSEWKPYKAIMDYCNHHVEGVLLVRKEGV
ncbi:MAG: SAF domain-containing protein [Clostridiales Family XIII bacterium]|nr:SAF domain-containing protein [Clostridiales Family XIII bacterium]